jgi:hypothetical protein
LEDAETSALRASDVQPRAVEWLWWPYIPVGKLSAVAGQMGQAKSLFTDWLAAAVSQGRGLNLARPGNVLMLSAEDDPEDTTVPRLKGAGADLDRVTLLADWTLDAGSLERHCAERGDVKLITVDPLSAYFETKVDSWKGQHVRRALEPVRRLAQERGLAVLLVQHLNRRADTTEALARIADSQGIPALARSVLIWGPNPSDPEGDRGSLKVLARAKGNLARGTAAATFEIVETRTEDGHDVPKLLHLGEADVRAEDVVSSESVRTQTEAAIVFLRDQLAGGPREAEEVKAAAAEADVSEKCLRRARERVCRSYRPEGNHGPYVWELTKRQGIQGHPGAFTPVGALDPGMPSDPCLPLDAQDARHHGTNDELRNAVRGLAELSPAEAEAEWRRLEAKFGGAA